MGKGSLRNKFCPCGSGKKYKDCHLRRGVDFYDLEKATQLKKAINSNRPKLCLLKGNGGCSSNIIRAHNIQNKGILSHISVNGDVVIIGFNPEKMSKGSPGIDFEKKGKGSATTFTGLCGKHDNEVFEPIDNYDYKKGDKEQEFLLAIRAFLFERYKKEGAIKLLEYFTNNIPDTDRLLPALKGHRNAIQYMEQYLRIFHRELIKKTFQSIYSFVVTLDSEYLVAVSSAFGLEYDLKGNNVQDISDLSQRLKAIFLTIFPQDGHTYIIFSYLSEDIEVFDNFRKQFQALKEKDKLKTLDNLFTGYVENFVISPKIYDQLTVDSKKRYINEALELTHRSKLPTDLTREPVINFFIKS